MLHALSWCDSAPIFFGDGKAKALAVAREVHLQHPGRKDDNLNDVLLGSTAMLVNFKGNRIFLKIISRECGKITDPSEARTHDP